MNDTVKLIEEYRAVKSALDKTKKLENKLRLEILSEIFPTQSSGTVNKEIGQFKIKATFRTNYKIDAKELEEIKAILPDEELNCIAYKPSLKLAEYKNLDRSFGCILDDAITATPGLPSVSVEFVEDDFQEWSESHEG